ncbi:hypothetical protein [Hymenobacter elongatus]|uniref:Uncharacterized protein n=1 Tax=Hymenobacter elongatus TaxID=877208 RepID=A0A4Z0PUH8_9BACT|nr:hypothetical protein [Hymenobacter elongatus]TGE20052.1 hypothetical protein E5J99_00345 [Hymenobacter elongatus]
MKMTLTRSAGPALASAVATVYTKGGQTLRVPLRRAPAGPGCAGHPEQQLMRWFSRQAAAEPGFPVRVRSMLLITTAGGCRPCQQALVRFLSRYHLGKKLRQLTAGPKSGCGCHRCQSRAEEGGSLVLDELLGETPPGAPLWPPLPSPGIPEGDGQRPSTGNSLHATAGAAQRAAAAEAARRNAASTRSNARFRFRVAHHGAKQPLDAPHYHVIDEQGRQISGHFFYGKQPIRTQKKDRPTAPAYDRLTAYPGPDPATSYSQYRTEWHGARANKAEGRQRRHLRKGYELEHAVPMLPVPPAAPLTARDLTPQALLHPNLDVHAQRALLRMARSADSFYRDAAVNILTEVRAGRLRGVFIENQRAPALRARRQGLGWWQILTPGDDSTKLDDPAEAPMLVFRESIRNNPRRLDEALLVAWSLPLAVVPRGVYGRPL